MSRDCFLTCSSRISAGKRYFQVRDDYFGKKMLAISYKDFCQ